MYQFQSLTSIFFYSFFFCQNLYERASAVHGQLEVSIYNGHAEGITLSDRLKAARPICVWPLSHRSDRIGRQEALRTHIFFTACICVGVGTVPQTQTTPLTSRISLTLFRDSRSFGSIQETRKRPLVCFFFSDYIEEVGFVLIPLERSKTNNTDCWGYCPPL